VTNHIRQLRSRAAFTLVEAVMSMLVISILLVCSMRVAGACGKMQYKAAEVASGRVLADGLLNDIRALNYEEPNGTPAFGIESGESSSSKVNYDDVDDFSNWVETPPQDKDGSAISNLTGWKRSVAIDRVNPSNLASVVTSETGVKRITVTVYHNGLQVAQRTAFRTNAP
jgi:hypothetical protein